MVLVAQLVRALGCGPSGCRFKSGRAPQNYKKRVQVPYTSRMKCFQIKVSGFVQGVFFRHSAKNEAEKLGLVGYAKNLPSHLQEGSGGLDDGSVEIVVCGDKIKIEEFVKWCHHGPALAQVDSVEIKEIAQQKFSDFRIL